MKKFIKYSFLVAIATLVSNNSMGKEKPGGSSGGGNGSGMSKPAKPANMLKAANCTPTITEFNMAFNDVSAILETGGRMFQQTGAQGNAGYEVPRTALGNGPKAIYSGSLWMGGKDNNGQLKLAALCFRQNGNDFWAGPLQVPQIPNSDVDDDPNVPWTATTVSDYGQGGTFLEECTQWDKFFPMSKALVIRYTTWWEACSGNSPFADATICAEINAEADGTPTNADIAAINNWPAHGDTGVEIGASNQAHYLAPYYNYDGAGDYDPDSGDTPWYDDILGRDDIECGVDRRISLFGDNTVWWVFNDQGNIHTSSQGEPIGMEIRAQAFTFSTADAVNRMTFYNYELINRGSSTLGETFFSQYLDTDLGNSTDDYVGCDVSRGLGYCYNGDEVDETNAQSVGYGNNPPAIGCDFFEGPYQDIDGMDNPGPIVDETTGIVSLVTYAQAIAGDGIVYRGIGVGYGDGIIDNERFGMRRFTYFTLTSIFPYTDPTVAVQYYNFMNGFWADGSLMTYGGLGSLGSVQTDYMFPGTSDAIGWGTAGVPQAEWTEVSAGNAPADRRMVQSAGPFTLTPGAMNNITVGIVYGRSLEGANASVEIMKVADTKAQALFDACFRIIDPPNAPKLTIQELENELVLMLDNPSPSNNVDEEYNKIDDINIPIGSGDRFFKFQGYQIFQMINDAASVSDIRDNTKARLVAQCDIKDNVSRLVNYEFNESFGFASPEIMVDGENTGIKHSFRITEDQFASGVKTLVNHKTYYYVAVAYAHNEFKKYDPTDPGALDGQKIPYIVSRLGFNQLSIRSQAAVPHNPSPELNGTYQNVEFGTIPRITRLDGTGNGYGILELTAASQNQIVANGSMTNPTYEINGGPINVKVVDPLNVAPGYFTLKFRDYNVNPLLNAADTARWTAYRYTSEGGGLIDSVRSDRFIRSDNEQIIPEWGVSIQIHQTKYVGASPQHSPAEYTTDPLSATINFADSNRRWMTFVPDNDQYYPTNWIRSGIYESPTDDHLPPGSDPWLDPKNYRDEVGFDNSKVFAKLLNGGVAPHKLTGYQADYMPLAYHPVGVAFDIPIVRRNAAIASHPSVNIVITSDKTKWTRCPVIEMGRVQSLNVGGARPGELRRSPSVNKDLQNDGTGTTGMGWFPGYAVDLETGTRMHMAFGENSFLSADKGSDMNWNPTSRFVLNTGEPIFGGVQPIWVFAADIKIVNTYATLASLQNFPAYNPSVDDGASNFLQGQFDIMQTGSVVDGRAAFRRVFSSLMWVSYPMTIPGQITRSSDLTIKLRINKEYKNYVTTGSNNGRPMYSWNMDGLATTLNSSDALAEALATINIVPNPYYAFSEYERSRIDTRVKITNLPEKCSVNIYSTNGKLIRTFEKDSEITSVDWDLNNNKRIPIASGVYFIHVVVPGIGERVLKFFAGMRQVDLQGI